MTGIVVITHGRLGEALISTAEFIFDEQVEAIISVSINPTPVSTSPHSKIAEGN